MISGIIWFLGWSGYFWTVALLAAALASFIYLPKIGTHIAVILCMVAGGSLLSGEFYSAGASATEAKWQSKLADEVARRDKELVITQETAAKTVIALETERQNNERLHREIDLASRSSDGRACLAPEQLRKLQEFRRR